jgi:hypothetical protein
MAVQTRSAMPPKPNPISKYRDERADAGPDALIQQWWMTDAAR